MTPPFRYRLSERQEDALLTEQSALIERLMARVAELEALLGRPKKTSKNSHTRPSQDQKPGAGAAKSDDQGRKPRPSRPGVSRQLSDEPNETVRRFAATCPHCAADVSGARQHRRRETLKDTTLRRYHARAERRVDALVALPPAHHAGRDLQAAVKAWRTNFFVFPQDREVPPTNNVSERELRPSVVFRKVTGCFRSDWGARIHAGYRSITGTAKPHANTALQTIDQLLSGTHKPHPPLEKQLPVGQAAFISGRVD